MKYILAVDQSTTGTKAILFGQDGTIVGRAYKIHKQYHPRTGWVEQDAAEIYRLTLACMREALATSGIPEGDVAALALTVQTGAFVVWDKATGDPVHHMIGWQCNRGQEFCEALPASEREHIERASGTEASGYLPAAKLKWMLDALPGLRERAEAGEVLFGTVETFLIWKLTGGKVHASDYCNASITQLFDVTALQWDPALLRIFTVPGRMLPDVRNADADFGTVAAEGLPPLPITGVIGDSAAALFGQCGFARDSVKITYGTGSSILRNLGPIPVAPPKGMTTSLAWRMGGDEVTYVWEGTAVCTGGVIDWLVNDLGILDKPSDSEEIARGVENCGVYFVPAFSGLGAPYRDGKAKACITGMTTGTGRPHIVRAALESIAYQIKDMVEAMNAATNSPVSRILADGGVTRNELLMQFQADLLDVPIVRSDLEESSALGVMYMAALAVGIYRDREEIAALARNARTFVSTVEPKKRGEWYAGWKHAVAQSRL